MDPTEEQPVPVEIHRRLLVGEVVGCLVLFGRRWPWWGERVFHPKKCEYKICTRDALPLFLDQLTV